MDSLEIYRRDLLLNQGYSFRPTTDDWYPNFPGDTVGITTWHDKTGSRIVIRGADDTGMEITLPSKEAVEALYRRIPSVISRQDLIQLGFRYT